WKPATNRASRVPTSSVSGQARLKPIIIQTTASSAAVSARATSAYRPPTADHRLLTADCRPPTTDCRPPTTDHRPPTLRLRASRSAYLLVSLSPCHLVTLSPCLLVTRSPPH